MQVAIDASELCGRPTGVGRYLAHLLDAWGELPDARAHRFTLFSPSGIALETVAPRAHTLNLTIQTLPGSGGTRWQQLDLASAVRRARPDVFFAPAYTAPLFGGGVPTVVTVHDVSFEAHPEWFRWSEGARLRWLTRATVKRARRVLTDSEFSRREIIQRLRAPADRVRVVRLGVGQPRSSSWLPASAGSLPAEGGSHVQPLILFVGSLFNRRHLPDLIAAFEELRRTSPDARLEIVGENRTFPPQDLAGDIARRDLGNRVAMRSYVSDDELARLYASARVFAFLSEYEGFGLTPLEALAAGVPIVVLDTPIAREMYGDAATYVQHGDISGTAQALESMIRDEHARRRVLDHAPDVLNRLSWSSAAKETLEALTT